jgi:hypothetical protein
MSGSMPIVPSLESSMASFIIQLSGTKVMMVLSMVGASCLASLKAGGARSSRTNSKSFASN